MFHIEFNDGVHITIDDEENVIVNNLSATDVHFNTVAGMASDSETEFIRLCNIINNRLGVEVL